MRAPDRYCLGAALAALAALALAGPGARLGWWHFRTGFALLEWAAYGGLAAAAAAVAVWARRDGRDRPRTRRLALALAAGLATAAIPWTVRRAARQAPPIHDVSTDTQDPPRFEVILKLRADAPNPAEYGGPLVARQQAEAYPDLKPLTLPLPKEQAFAQALGAAGELGWQIESADRDAGRLEATATTRWFGFKDDVVVRVREEGTGSRVDVRSVSRVGKGDAGANARRIRRFLRRLTN